MLQILGMVVAVLVGFYIGLGFPGLPGPVDRVLPKGMKRQRKRRFTPIDLLRRWERPSERRR